MLEELPLAFHASSDVNDREGANQRTKKLNMISDKVHALNLLYYNNPIKNKSYVDGYCILYRILRNWFEIGY